MSQRSLFFFVNRVCIAASVIFATAFVGHTSVIVSNSCRPLDLSHRYWTWIRGKVIYLRAMGVKNLFVSLSAALVLMLGAEELYAACYKTCSENVSYPCSKQCPATCGWTEVPHPFGENRCVSHGKRDSLIQDKLLEKNSKYFNESIKPAVEKQNHEINSLGRNIYNNCQQYESEISKQMGLLYHLDRFQRKEDRLFSFGYSILAEDREKTIYPVVYDLLDIARRDCVNLFVGLVPRIAESSYKNMKTSDGLSVEKTEGIKNYIGGASGKIKQILVKHRFEDGKSEEEELTFHLKAVKRYKLSEDKQYWTSKDPARKYIATNLEMRKPLYKEYDLIAQGPKKGDLYNNGHQKGLLYGLERSMRKVVLGLPDSSGLETLNLMSGKAMRDFKSEAEANPLISDDLKNQTLKKLLADRILMSGRFAKANFSPSQDSSSNGLGALYYYYSSQAYSLHQAGSRGIGSFQTALNRDYNRYGVTPTLDDLKKYRDDYRENALKPYVSRKSFIERNRSIWHSAANTNANSEEYINYIKSLTNIIAMSNFLEVDELEAISKNIEELMKRIYPDYSGKEALPLNKIGAVIVAMITSSDLLKSHFNGGETDYSLYRPNESDLGKSEVSFLDDMFSKFKDKYRLDNNLSRAENDSYYKLEKLISFVSLAQVVEGGVLPLKTLSSRALTSSLKFWDDFYNGGGRSNMPPGLRRVFSLEDLSEDDSLALVKDFRDWFSEEHPGANELPDELDDFIEQEKQGRYISRYMESLRKRKANTLARIYGKDEKEIADAELKEYEDGMFETEELPLKRSIVRSWRSTRAHDRLDDSFRWVRWRNGRSGDAYRLFRTSSASSSSTTQNILGLTLPSSHLVASASLAQVNFISAAVFGDIVKASAATTSSISVSFVAVNSSASLASVLFSIFSF